MFRITMDFNDLIGWILIGICLLFLVLLYVHVKIEELKQKWRRKREAKKSGKTNQDEEAGKS